jgi:hypothetical protein
MEQATQLQQMYELIIIKGRHKDDLQNSKCLRFQNLEQIPTSARKNQNLAK